MQEAQQNNIYAYLFIMAAVTYLVRVLPLTLIRWEIRNSFLRSFLHYVPYATISAMTFPAILNCTRSVASASVAFITALICSYFGKNMVTVAFASCAAVYIAEYIIIK